MLRSPSTITDLISRLSNGDDPTPEELRRLQKIQALQIAQIGEQYLAETMDDLEAAEEQLKQLVGRSNV